MLNTYVIIGHVGAEQHHFETCHNANDGRGPHFPRPKLRSAVACNDISALTTSSTWLRHDSVTCAHVWHEPPCLCLWRHSTCHVYEGIHEADNLFLVALAQTMRLRNRLIATIRFLIVIRRFLFGIRCIYPG